MTTEPTRTQNTERDGTVPLQFRVGLTASVLAQAGGVPRQFSVFKGFTLIEVLLSLAIVAIITAVGVTSLSNFNQEAALSVETGKVLSLLSKARSLTLSAKDGAAYGVHFEERKAVLFKGGAYSAGDAGNQTQALQTEVNISAISLAGGGSDVVFKRLTSATSQSGTITLSLVRVPSATKVITIGVTGVAYSN